MIFGPRYGKLEYRVVQRYHSGGTLPAGGSYTQRHALHNARKAALPNEALPMNDRSYQPVFQKVSGTPISGAYKKELKFTLREMGRLYQRSIQSLIEALQSPGSQGAS